MVLALIKKPFVWVWALLTAPIRWLRGGRRRHRRGLFSKVGDLMPTLSFMSFMRGGGGEAELPLQCERDQQPGEEAPPARVVEEERISARPFLYGGANVYGKGYVEGSKPKWEGVSKPKRRGDSRATRVSPSEAPTWSPHW